MIDYHDCGAGDGDRGDMHIYRGETMLGRE